MPIIISKGGKDAMKVDKSAPDREEFLQKYIQENPESIPLYDIHEDIRLLIVSREFVTTSGAIDALGVDNSGNLYLIETKLYKNPEKRRVVAQVLDYGASLWAARGEFNQVLAKIEEEVLSRYGVGLRDKLTQHFSLSPEATAQLLEKLASDFNEGKFKFVVLMDKLHEALRDLVIYINQNSKFDIYAVELEFYKFDQYEIVIPKLFGAEARKETVSESSSRRSTWDEAKFFTDAEQRVASEHLQAMRDLHEYTNRVAEVAWGTGAKTGSFGARFTEICTRTIYTVYSNGLLALNFGWLHDSDVARQFRDALKARLDDLEVFGIPENYQKVYLHKPPEVWAPVLEQFIEALNKTRESIR